MIVRATIPGAAATNGRPERKGYTYNGTGQDQMPWLGDEALAPYRVDYQQWIPDLPRGSSAPAAGKCQGCGYGPRSANHRILCGAR